MDVPDTQSLLLPVMRVLASAPAEGLHASSVVAQVSEQLRLPKEVIESRLPTGSSRFGGRVNWALPICGKP